MVKKIHFVLVVWGPEYTDYFLRLCLPTLLTPNNLPVFQQFGECSFQIYTRAVDAEIMKQDARFRQIPSDISIEFHWIDSGLDMGNKGFRMTECHNDAVRDAYKKQAYMFFLAPDLIFSDGSIRKVCELLTQGYKGVLVCPIHVMRECFIPDFLARYYNSKTKNAIISHRQLISLGKKHQHPTSNFFLWSSLHYNNVTPCLFGWQAADDAMLVRSTQFHPLVLFPEKDVLLENSKWRTHTIDTVLADSLIGDSQQSLYFLRDSDEGVVAGLRPISEIYSVEFDLPNIPMIAFHFNWFRGNGNGNLDYLEEPIWFHSADVPEMLKKEYVEKSADVLQLILDMSRFNSIDEFLVKVKSFYKSNIGNRKIVILGSGYFLETTLRFLGKLELEGRCISEIRDMHEDEYLFLAVDFSVLELTVSQLFSRGLCHERDFMISPMVYRVFRRSMPVLSFWEKLYYEYYLFARGMGFRWCLKAVTGKLMLSTMRGPR